VIWKAILNRIAVLAHPDKEFSRLPKTSLELLVKEYFILLLISGLVAGVFSLLYGIGNAVYLKTFLNVDVQFLRMLNYLLGKFVSIMFFFLFAGTFLFFIVSIILRIFIKIKYVDMIKIMLLSISPLLLMAWLPWSVIPLIVWSAILFIVGISQQKTQTIKKNSLKQRD
jgi:hypothetical protein